MGTVYRARQEPIGREVALKVLRADRSFDALSKARFVREARAMSLLTSPHTATVFDFGEIPSNANEAGDSTHASLYLAMELLQGESVGARLKRQGRMGVDEAVTVARHALASLAEAHEKGIIHRDLKPDNLLLTRAVSSEHGEVCKVLDFGIAKIKSEHGAVNALKTQAGTVFGTPRYMSPEQAQGKPLDERSDLYALGVVLYHMLVGRPPFLDDDAIVVMARHIRTQPMPPAQANPNAKIGAALSHVVMCALAKRASDRPRGAAEFVALLDAAMVARAEEIEKPTLAPSTASTSSGEVAVVVPDDFSAQKSGVEPPRSRTRAGLTAFLMALFALGLTAFAVTGALQNRRGVPATARAELKYFVAERRLALARSEANERESAIIGLSSAQQPLDPAPKPTDSATLPADVSQTLPGAPMKARRLRRYKMFE